MKKVITFGVFDCLHYGHIRLFQKCKKYGDYLVVAIQTDEFVVKNKPNTQLMCSLEERIELINELKSVDKIISYDQIDETISSVDFDILCVGPDQTNDHFKKAISWCNKHNKEVVVVQRTPSISSTLIRKI